MDHPSALPIAALFHVVFDQKVGYTLSWHHTVPSSLGLSGVEYKALPSGLHAVKSDIVYFIHSAEKPGTPEEDDERAEEYAGIAAFARGKADGAHRNARFCAVGALVPLGKHGNGGRLGKIWLHAPALREIAEGLVSKGEGTDKRALELYWKKHSLPGVANVDGRADSKARSASPERRRENVLTGLENKRALSAGLNVDAGMAPDHPALYMPALLTMFGPLLFPLYRAALLCQRILLLGSAPVQQNCNIVYILSVLSSPPQDLADVLSPGSQQLRAIRLLFNVGIPDIATLSSDSESDDNVGGYIATTTDDILGEKHHLYDLLVEIAPSAPGSKLKWPRLRTNEGKVIKASQRDLRRYHLLRNELRRLRLARKRDYDNSADGGDGEDGEEAPLMAGNRHFLSEDAAEEEMCDSETGVVEPQSWTAVAYNSFVWWASAGSSTQPAETEEEEHLDRELLADLPDLRDVMPAASKSAPWDEGAQLLEAQEVATVLTAYCHRFTSHLVKSLAEIVEGADDETETGVEEEAIEISGEDVRAMGLDSWSENDKAFVVEMVKRYFGRQAVVKEESWEVCGLRVC